MFGAGDDRSVTAFSKCKLCVSGPRLLGMVATGLGFQVRDQEKLWKSIKGMRGLCLKEILGIVCFEADLKGNLEGPALDPKGKVLVRLACWPCGCWCHGPLLYRHTTAGEEKNPGETPCWGAGREGELDVWENWFPDKPEET